MPAKAPSESQERSGRRKDTRTYAERRKAREARQEQERVDSKDFWDRVERIASKAFSPDALKVYAGAGLGGLAFYPQTIDVVFDHADVVVIGSGTPPEEKEACEDVARVRHEAENDRIQRDYEACIATCGGGTPDRVQRCLEGCEASRLRKQRAEDARYFAETDRCGDWRTVGADYTFYFGCTLTCYVHTLIPEVKIDVPSLLGLTPEVKFNLRDAFRFFVTKGIVRRVREPAPGAYRDGIPIAIVDAARASAKLEVVGVLKRDFLLIGLGAGASGALIAEFLTATGDILKGVGEIVPG